MTTLRNAPLYRSLIAFLLIRSPDGLSGHCIRIHVAIHYRIISSTIEVQPHYSRAGTSPPPGSDLPLADSGREAHCSSVQGSARHRASPGWTVLSLLVR